MLGLAEGPWSAGDLSRLTAGGYGPNQSQVKARPSTSHCRSSRSSWSVFRLVFQPPDLQRRLQGIPRSPDRVRLPHRGASCEPGLLGLGSLDRRCGAAQCTRPPAPNWVTSPVSPHIAEGLYARRRSQALMLLYVPLTRRIPAVISHPSACLLASGNALIGCLVASLCSVCQSRTIAGSRFRPPHS